ncbi:hypothetical protein IMCC1989_2325 [gamma proteobacterium IMCC1989]|nr:hypothetical protein IMCC1989_2325 [gamma proteobacterium IMCC1989]
MKTFHVNEEPKTNKNGFNLLKRHVFFVKKENEKLPLGDKISFNEKKSLKALGKLTQSIG